MGKGRRKGDELTKKKEVGEERRRLKRNKKKTTKNRKASKGTSEHLVFSRVEFLPSHIYTNTFASFPPTVVVF